MTIHLQQMVEMSLGAITVLITVLNVVWILNVSVMVRLNDA